MSDTEQASDAERVVKHKKKKVKVEEALLSPKKAKKVKTSSKKVADADVDMDADSSAAAAATVADSEAEAAVNALPIFQEEKSAGSPKKKKKAAPVVVRPATPPPPSPVVVPPTPVAAAAAVTPVDKSVDKKKKAGKKRKAESESEASSEEEEEADSDSSDDDKKKKKKSKKSAKKTKSKKKGKGDSDSDSDSGASSGSDGGSDSSDEEDGSDGSDDDDSDSGDEDKKKNGAASTPSAPASFMKPYATPVKPVNACVNIPEGTNFVNPNNTVLYHSLARHLNVHYTQIDPAKHLQITASKPYVSKAGKSKQYGAVKCLRDQRFDFTGTGKYQPFPYRTANIIGPFCKAKFARLWPHGNRFSGTAAVPGPSGPTAVKFQFPLHEDSYLAQNVIDKDGVGSVDADAHQFVDQWVRAFEKWAPGAAWGSMDSVFRDETERAKTSLPKVIAAAKEKYKADLKQWKADKKKQKKEKKEGGKKKRKLKKPKEVDEKDPAFLRSCFIESMSTNNMVCKDGHVNFNRPVFRKQNKIDIQNNFRPNLHGDKYLIDNYTNPPKFKRKTTGQDESGQKMEVETEEDGTPLIPEDVPLLRVVTLEEAKELKAKGVVNPDPYRPVAWKDRFVENEDVVAPMFSVDMYDTPLGSGFRYILTAVIWLGEAGALDPERQAPPMSELDPTTYFLTAQKYERTAANWKPATVERPAQNGGGFPSAAAGGGARAKNGAAAAGQSFATSNGEYDAFASNSAADTAAASVAALQAAGWSAEDAEEE